MKNEENSELQNSINTDIIYIKVNSVLTEIKNKFTLLSLINQSEDNSSELAGFEINKLLKEQSKLENLYNDLITKRTLLKGIKNKQKYLKIQDRINDVSKKLKESTKKLCRLFKENKNLNEDLVKVKGEREEAVFLIDELLDNLKKKSFGKFEEQILVELEGHNKLEDFTKKEKKLRMEIKKLTFKINTENQAFQSEMDEKNLNILKLKKGLNKTKTESMVKLKYQLKELETCEATQLRLYRQTEEDLLKEKKNIEEIRDQEEIVFKKNKEYLQRENLKLQNKIEKWTKKMQDSTNDFEEKIKLLEILKNNDEKRLDNLSNIYEEEIRRKREDERRLKEVFEGRRRKKEEEGMREGVVRVIQFYFEDWYEKVGQFQKKKKKKSKK